MVVKERDMRNDILPTTASITSPDPAETGGHKQHKNTHTYQDASRVIEHKPVKTNISGGLQVELHQVEIKVSQVIWKLQIVTQQAHNLRE